MNLFIKISKGDLANYSEQFIECLKHNSSNSHIKKIFIYTDDIDHNIKSLDKTKVFYKRNLPTNSQIVDYSKSLKENKIIFSDAFIKFEEDLYKVTDGDLENFVITGNGYYIYSVNTNLVNKDRNLEFTKREKNLQLKTSIIRRSSNVEKKQNDSQILVKKSVYRPPQILPTKRDKKLDVIIVSVDYNDYLVLTLEQNLKIFENITIVTSEDDNLCQEICKKYQVNCVVTNVMYEDGAKFNKGKAINVGINSLENPDLILLLDADIIVENQIDLNLLSDEVLYTSERIILLNYKSYQDYIENGKNKRTKLENDKGYGFFQLFCINTTFIDKNKPFPENSNDASYSDLGFRDKFSSKQTINQPCLHLGEPFRNWKGRQTEKFLSTEELENKISLIKPFNLNNYFDKIYCLNLDRRTDRWEKVSQEFDRFNIKVERWRAIDGINIEDDILNYYNPNQITGEKASQYGIVENKNSIGCLLSHLSILKNAKENGYKRILIFEDDIILVDNFIESVKKISRKKWELLYLGASQFDWSNILISNGFYKCKKTLGTFAYAINSNIFDQLIEIYTNGKKSVDNILSEFQDTNEGCFTIFPNIVVSDVRDSDIRYSKDLESYSKSMRWNQTDFNEKKIALLFLTTGSLKKEENWIDFIKQGKNKLSIYSHSKIKTNQKIIDESQIEKKVDTKWGDISLVKATINLLEESYRNPENQFFILLSESCIPIYSFDYIYKKIINEDKSWLFYYKWTHKHNIDRFNKLKNTLLLNLDEFYKQSQFMMLRRDHVKLILENNYIEMFEKTTVPDEHYFINVLKKLNKNFDNQNICYPLTSVYRLDGKDENGVTNPIETLKIYNIEDCRNDFEDIKLQIDEKSDSLFFRKVSEKTKIDKKLCTYLKKDIALLNLTQLTDILEKNKVTHWITDGTLLGAKREGSFIEHDKDTDIGVLFNTFNKESFDDIIRNGFELNHIFGYVEDSLEISFVKNGVKTDLFFFYEEGDKLRHSAFFNITKAGYDRVDYFYKKFEVSKQFFLGKNFNMPDSWEDFLVTKYGHDWGIVKKEWHWATSPLNAKQTGIYIKQNISDGKFKKWIEEQSNLKKLTILIKSFNRKDCVENLILSIRNRYSNISILIIDDSYPQLNFDTDVNIKTINLEFDRGLSFCRNHGVSMIETDYFLLLDDDFEFSDQTDLLEMLRIFELSGLDMLGGIVIENEKPLDYYGKFYYDVNSKTLSVEKKIEDYVIYKKCDIILNFFIAKTSEIKINKWDDELKLAEHTAFFYDNLGKLKVGYTDKISIIHKKTRDPEYSTYRNRGEYFFNKWLKKKNIGTYINIKGQKFNQKS